MYLISNFSYVLTISCLTFMTCYGDNLSSSVPDIDLHSAVEEAAWAIKA